MVALITTIVLLLILASISIQGITRTGIFSSAEKVKLEHKRASIATTLQAELKLSQTEKIRDNDEQVMRAAYENVKNNIDKIKSAGGKDIKVGEVTSEKKNKKIEWFFEVKVDGDIYKVGIDGSDFLGEEDKLSPIIQIEKVHATTKTITATVSTRRNEGGKIEYYIKEKGSSNFNLAKSTEEKEFTYTELKQNTTFVIEAVAIGKNGKKKVSNEYEIKTSTVPKIDSKNIKFTVNPNTWTNGSVKVTATLNVDGQNYDLVTSKNSLSGWEKENTQTFISNGTMYVALTDGKNYGGVASYEVTNIDKEKPVIKSLTVSTNTIKIMATDNDSGIVAYAISENSVMPTNFITVDNTKIFSKILENKKQSTIYYVWTKDQAGNISEVASTKTNTVPQLTDENITIVKTPSDWTNKDVTVTVSTTEKNFALQTKKDNGEWQTTGTQTFTENGIIYARLWDGINASIETHKEITNIERVVPTKPIVTAKVGSDTGSEYISGTWTNQQVIITATSSDTQSQINRIEYSYDKQTWATNWGTNLVTNGNQKSIKGTWGTQYNKTVYVRAIDNAGNISEVSSIEVKHDTVAPTKPIITAKTGSDSGNTYTGGTWTTQPVVIMATSSDTQSQINRIEYSHDNKTWATNWGTNLVTNGNEKSIKGTWGTGYNTVVYVRAIDNAGNVSDVSSIELKHDVTAPVINTALSGTTTSNSINLSMSVSDSQSGVTKIIWYYKLSTDTVYKSETDTYTATTANTKRTHSFSGLTQKTTYNAYAVVYDALGNKRQSSTINVTTAKVPDAEIEKNIYFKSDSKLAWTNREETITAYTDLVGYSVQTSIDGINWKDSASQTYSDNGIMYARLTDGTNIGKMGAYNVTNIDKIAPIKPTLTVNTISGNTEEYYVSGTWTDKKVKITATSSDDDSGISLIEYSYDKVNWQSNWGGSGSIYGKQESICGIWAGEYNNIVYARATDNAGNVSEISSGFEIKIDPVSPRIMSSLYGTCKETEMTLNIQVRDFALDKIVYHYKLQSETNYVQSYEEKINKSGPVEVSTNITGLKLNSIYDVYAVIYDKIGNKSTTETISVSTRKEDEFVTITPYAWTNDNVKVTFKELNGILPVYTLDGTKPTSSSKKYSEPFCVSENCTITYAYMDGNIIKYSGTINITNIDKTAPTKPEITTYKYLYDEANTDYDLGKLVDYTSGTWTNDAIRIEAKSTDSQSKVNKIQYSSDKINWGNNWNNNLVTNGNQKSIFGDWYQDMMIYIRAIDNAGNISEISDVMLRVDRTKPVITKTLTPISVGKNQATLSLSVKDVDSGISKIVWTEVLYAAQGGPANSWTTSISDLHTDTGGPTTELTKTMSFTKLEAGVNHYFKATVYDVAGNKVETEMISVKIDS